MKRSTDRIRTTHVGSIARLPEVAKLIGARERGELKDEVAFAKGVRAAVDEVVRRQVEAGIDTISDGEQGKSSFNNYITERLTGFERRPGRPSGSGSNWAGTRERLAFPEFYEWYGRSVGEQLSAPGIFVCTGPVKYTGHAPLKRDIDNLKTAAAASGADEAFMPAVAATMVAATRPNEHYRTEEEYMQAVADALREEYRAILDAGLVLQIDDPRLVSQYTMVPDMSVEDVRKWAWHCAEVLNYSLRGLPTDMVRFHTCYSIDIGPRLNDLDLS
jgi:5-methyltetrahydropteroyltriglutamate--homocysteine methyltransferase